MESNHEFLQRLNKTKMGVNQRAVEMQFNFTNVPPETVILIHSAIELGQPFGLTNERGAMNVFNPATLSHYTVGSNRRYISLPTVIQYDSLEKFANGISLALLTCKTFLNHDLLIKETVIDVIQERIIGNVNL